MADILFIKGKVWFTYETLSHDQCMSVCMCVCMNVCVCVRDSMCILLSHFLYLVLCRSIFPKELGPFQQSRPGLTMVGLIWDQQDYSCQHTYCP